MLVDCSILFCSNFKLHIMVQSYTDIKTIILCCFFALLLLYLSNNFLLTTTSITPTVPEYAPSFAAWCCRRNCVRSAKPMIHRAVNPHPDQVEHIRRWGNWRLCPILALFARGGAWFLALHCESMASAATKDSPRVFGSVAISPTLYHSLKSRWRICPKLCGTSSNVAVPTAPTLGRKPYMDMQMVRSWSGVWRSVIHPVVENERRRKPVRKTHHKGYPYWIQLLFFRFLFACSSSPLP